MNNCKRIKNYIVDFEMIFKPGDEISDVQFIEIEVYAENIDDAQAKAWQAVTVNPDTYEISSIHSSYSRYSRRISRENC